MLRVTSEDKESVVAHADRKNQIANELRRIADGIERDEIVDYSVSRELFCNRVTQKGDKSHVYEASEHRVLLLTYSYHREAKE